MIDSKKIISISSLLLLTAIGATGCASFKGEYGDVNKAEILDDKWNPTDATNTVNKMVTDMSNAPWILNWREDMKKKQADKQKSSLSEKFGREA